MLWFQMAAGKTKRKAGYHPTRRMHPDTCTHYASQDAGAMNSIKQYRRSYEII